MSEEKKKRVWVGWVPDRSHWKHLFWWEPFLDEAHFLNLVGGIGKTKSALNQYKNTRKKIRITVEEL
jgi:hypothetical protein